MFNFQTDGSKLRVAGKQGFAALCFSKLFHIKQLRAMRLKTRNFIFSYCFVYFDIFSYFLPSNGHKPVLTNSHNNRIGLRIFHSLIPQRIGGIGHSSSDGIAARSQERNNGSNDPGYQQGLKSKINPIGKILQPLVHHDPGQGPSNDIGCHDQ
jgi:hypothetical protein